MTIELHTSFGRSQVSPEERRLRIRRVFARVARNYDLMNDMMSFGLHRLWKRSLARAMEPHMGHLVLDLAGGTGDVAKALASRGFAAIVCDPSLEMMEAGRKRGSTGVIWVAAEAESLPFASGSVDAVTISFGIRNVTNMKNALLEIARVLKPGGLFLCLEFSTPRRWLRPFYDLYSFFVIPRLGAAFARSPEAYTYLVESIRCFPSQREFKAIIEDAGFAAVTYRDFTFGIVSLHAARKPS